MSLLIARVVIVMTFVSAAAALSIIHSHVWGWFLFAAFLVAL